MDRQADMLNSEAAVGELVRQSQEGSRTAFDCLVKQFQFCAMKTAVRILADADEAAEAVQDAFVAAYLKIKKLKEPEKFGSWLLRIVTSRAIDRQKSAMRRKQLFRKMCNQPRAAPGHQDDPLYAEELQAAIQSAMSKLTKTQARAIAIFGIEELSHQEVADILGCSPQAARWHVYQARKKLKILLKDYLE